MNGAVPEKSDFFWNALLCGMWRSDAACGKFTDPGRSILPDGRDDSGISKND